MKKSKLYIIGGGIAATLVASLLVVWLLTPGTPAPINPEFGQFITAYSSGVISKNSTIKVRLLSEIAKQLDTNEVLKKDLFDFSPSIDGKIEWADPTTLEFVPDEPLPSDKKYVAKFRLGKLLNVKGDLSTFEFGFQTIEQNFEVQIDEIQTIDKKTLKYQKILGHVLTADGENVDNLKKVLEAKHEGKNLIIKWKPEQAEKSYEFEIDSILRTNKTSEVLIKWDGDEIDVDKKGKETVEVPSLDTFKYMFIKPIQEPEQYIKIQFSDPLDESQELEGMVQVGDWKEVRFLISNNVLKIYPPNVVSGNFKVVINEGITNILRKKLGKTSETMVSFEMLKPKVRFVNKGVILPTSENGLVLPFEAVNLRAVDVQILKIFENNIPQFLQVNNLNGDYELGRVGKAIVKKTIRLDQSNVIDFSKWNRFSLDLNDLLKAEPGAIYRVSINFRQKHSLYRCGDENSETNIELKSFSETSGNQNDMEEQNYWKSFDEYYYYYQDEEYDWNQRENPCNRSYFGGKNAVSQNIIASNLGMISKMGIDGKMKVFVTDLRSTEPMNGVKVDVYSYQNQLLATASTNRDGLAEFTKLDEPYFVIAKLDNQRGYLKVSDGASLSLTKFDVAGTQVTKGLKGFIYGERGVWRPGDSLFITFILQEENEPLPMNHPIVFELKNPQDKVVKRLVQQKSATNFYCYRFKTDDNSPTGNWNATVSVGGATFTKMLKIETVKPNRLRINLDFKEKFVVKDKLLEAKLSSQWLHGAIARNLETQVDIVLMAKKTEFEKFKDFEFDDISKKYESESQTIFDGRLNDEGKANISTTLTAGNQAPGVLEATFITKVFENGGNFSIDHFKMPYYPYTSMVGIKSPEGEPESGMLFTDREHKVDIVTVSPNGTLLNETHSVEMMLYKLDWRWWWDESEEYMPNFTYSYYYKPLQTQTVTTSGGKASWNVRINYPDWGRYIILAKDLKSGHTSSRIVYIDWPDWKSRMAKDNPDAAAMLSFTADKEKYSIGEKVHLTIPSSDKGRALISIENGTSVIETFWAETKSPQTKFDFTTIPEMAPNIYVHVTLIQPHAQTANDLPIRMYGIVPLTIEDADTHLNPKISMPDKLESETTISMSVSETNGKPMTYTIAMVDEGLLDLTHFKTPDPWTNFYAKEALGVKTWDIYDWVIGAFGGELSRLLSIGGDSEIDRKGGKKANRFPPMVRFMGPYQLAKGQTNKHKIEIPRYIGSVRTMVVAGNMKNAYGFTDKTTPVIKPLMLLGTLPRVLGPGETCKLPVSIFAMDKSIKDVTIEVKTNSLLEIVGSKTKKVTIKQEGEEYVEFDLKVLSELGIAKVQIFATSGSNKAQYDIELDVRNPNPPLTNVLSQMIEKGQSWTTEVAPFGLIGTNKATLEVSSIPPMNLEKRLKFLIAYPYGCVEQTTSSVFPQLYLENLVELSKTQKEDIARNIKAAIYRLSAFQTTSGGFAYWQGGNDVSEWGTNYAGHFLLEAEKKGYTIPTSMMKNWKKYQAEKARGWTEQGNYSQTTQAYRLFTLALANVPETGAMNRLRELQKLSGEVKWRLSAAYYLAGKKQIAEKLSENLKTTVEKYTDSYFTFGSDLRDKAMILETLSLLDKREAAFDLLKEISEQIGSEDWYSTQTTAYCLIAVSQYVGKNMTSSTTKFSYVFGKATPIEKTSTKSISQVNLDVKTLDKKSLVVNNTSNGVLFIRVIVTGTPGAVETNDASNGLRINVQYTMLNNATINPERLEQGTDFLVEVTVQNPSNKDYAQLALNQIIPSGWEILNARMADISTAGQVSTPSYQDIRDDRIYTFFDLGRGQTKTFKLSFNASYAGRYYMPAISVEAMYDAAINARKAGKWVEVVK